MSIAPLLGAIAFALFVWMAIAWIVVLRSGRSGFADVFWSYGVGLACVVAALLPTPADPPGPRAKIVAVIVAIWSLRLGTHILLRTIQGGDDPRYAELKRQWGDRYPLRLLIFLEIQAGAALVLATAVLAAARNPAPLNWLDGVAMAVALGAISGELVADRQLRNFSRQPHNKGSVCDAGLWARSRHPNYFFEWLFWVGGALFAISLPPSVTWIALAAPAMMYWLLRHVSGVPPLEEHMLRSRGDAFRAYQRRVPAFWPIGGFKGANDA